MPQQVQSPPSPQDNIENVSGTNRTAFIGPYTDRALTVRKPPAQTIADVPAKSGSTTLGDITVYDIPTVDHDPGDQGATQPAASGNKWVSGRDPYKNSGMVGQTFFNNQG